MPQKDSSGHELEKIKEVPKASIQAISTALKLAQAIGLSFSKRSISARGRVVWKDSFSGSFGLFPHGIFSFAKKGPGIFLQKSSALDDYSLHRRFEPQRSRICHVCAEDQPLSSPQRTTLLTPFIVRLPGSLICFVLRESSRKVQHASLHQKIKTKNNT